MKVGVHLPNGVPGVSGDTLLEWARRADDGPFSCLGVADRLVYHNVDPVVAMAASAAVTSRIEIVASILIPPLRPPAVFAKEVASLAVLAPGRLTVGVAVGARPGDYEAVGVPWKERGRVLDRCLEELFALREPADPPQSLGPALGDLSLLVGGASAAALARMVRWGDGYVSGGLKPMFFGFEASAAREAWRAGGREGTPRLVAGTWCASSEDTDDEAADWREAYLRQGGPPEPVRAEISRGADGVRRAVAEFEEAGADEIIFFPCVPHVSELDWLADLVSSL